MIYAACIIGGMLLGAAIYHLLVCYLEYRIWYG